ncbi:MAG: DNA polymerase II large subunit [Candidatus Woesearchaeota archaeon]|nr:MAG: DNA polymerase II large subunit [Candidatus Woesearchaeota archaeon]
MDFEIKKYFEEIENQLKKAYSIARKAKKKGYDPSEEVEIPLVRNLAERVIGIISIAAPQIVNTGIEKRIKELEDQYEQQNWRVALKIAEEVAKEKFCKFKDQREAAEVGIRIGFAYITGAVVSSPLEGFVRLEFKKRIKDGKEYFCLFYSGPIRSAGGTAASASLLIADYVRNKLGYSTYDPTEEEVKRISTEILDFHERVTNLQYLPSQEEAEFLASHLPMQISGDPSEEVEVSNYKDLKRIETNKLRNGVCLMFAEALAQKAPKVWSQISKWGKEFDLLHWSFLEDFIKIQKKIKARGSLAKEKTAELKILPDYTYISDAVAGRVVLSHPLRHGGFRLRYGRTRMTGLSSDGIHPATMKVLKNYIAIGTQLRTERPGKSTVVVTCDEIEGPIVKLNNGAVLTLETEEQAEKYVNDIEEIIYLGDILINYGYFLNRAHPLIPPGYCEEWWIQEVLQKGDVSIIAERTNIKKELMQTLVSSPIKTKILVDDAIKISKLLNVPLHPKYTYHWKALTTNNLKSLISSLKNAIIKRKESEITEIFIPWEFDIKIDLEQGDPKRALELLAVPHILSKGYILIAEDAAKALAVSLGFYSKDLNIKKLEEISQQDEKEILDLINSISEVKLRDKSGTFIGARMGRPEKAKIRKLKTSPQSLFPVGEEGGRLRCFQSALEKGKITADFPIYFCEECSKETIYKICEQCGGKTTKKYFCRNCNKRIETETCKTHKTKAQEYCNQTIDINNYFSAALKKLKLNQYPSLIKGVKGLTNKNNVPENLAKGILRSAHNLYVNKDGTVRYDMIELSITHFKPKEIGTNIEKLKELGYTKDIYGKPLAHEDQILEIKPQDVILPSCPDSLDEGAGIILSRIASFIDALLTKFYDLEPFYNISNQQDLVGHLIVGLSPHTCAGIIGRILGFSKTQGLIAHPYFHCRMRRDCDGDEAGVMLLMDSLLNFSKEYLPDHKGATQDEPLVFTSYIIPSEVDDMVFDMDIVDKYPLELYEAALQYKQPWEIKIKKIKEVLNTDAEYKGTLFTHDTTDINEGVLCSAYKSIPTMEEKVKGQMELADKIRAVDEADVARSLIERHFLRDIKGNLRKFSMQQFRCTNCNEKYRRTPLSGICGKCKGRIVLTVTEGSIIKYLEPALSLAQKYDLPPYIIQSLELTKQGIEQVFGKEKEKQSGLGKWF